MKGVDFGKDGGEKFRFFIKLSKYFIKYLDERIVLLGFCKIIFNGKCCFI